VDILALLGDRRSVERLGQRPWYRIEPTSDSGTLAAYRALRRRVFVTEQGLFDGDDADEVDADPRTEVLVARDRDGAVVGGVRLGPADPSGHDVGWWRGGRLVVEPAARRASAGSSAMGGMGMGGMGVGAALVRAACARAEAAGVLRFEATVQARAEAAFTRWGWRRVGPATVAGAPHVLMRWPIDRVAALAAATKSCLGPLLRDIRPGGPGFVGDDAAPVPGSDLVAACDSILPSMVEREPEWAGWCGVLVNLNDLAAMGARPVGLLDGLGARDASFASRVLAGLRKAAAAYGVPLLGGHTQLGVPAALTVTALGRATDPVPGGGGRPGDEVRLTADLGGRWRPGHTGRQWDSTTYRSTAELRAMLDCVVAGPSSPSSPSRAARPAAAKDVSMAGLVGTLGMLAEASGCGAELDVAAVPRPAGTTAGDWLTCFPGFAMLTAAALGTPAPAAGPAVSAACGRLVAGSGVWLVWPDGVRTPVLTGPVTGLGAA